MIVASLFFEFVLLSFVAFGGATALLPEMHRVVVEHHQWLDDTTFTHLYAIAQAAPGPNVLVVTLIGWKVAGLAGALSFLDFRDFSRSTAKSLQNQSSSRNSADLAWAGSPSPCAKVEATRPKVCAPVCETLIRLVRF